MWASLANAQRVNPALRLQSAMPQNKESRLRGGFLNFQLKQSGSSKTELPAASFPAPVSDGADTQEAKDHHGPS